MQGKIALVTGGGSGIGRAVALALGNADYTVVVTGRRVEPLRDVAAALGESGVAISCDVTDENSVASLFDEVRASFGRLDLLFNNAGTSAPPAPLEEITPQQWRSVVDTNLTGAFLCTQAAFRIMKAQDPRGGRIINNGSISATSPRPWMIPYTASKHGITGLTRATSLEGREFDIACGQIDIGNADTAMTGAIARGTLQADLSVRPEPTLDVSHVAAAVVYMAGLPLNANVLFMTVMATKMPYVGRG
jgi:NAD(P)-dependent dehydrogenase (short-subunit alcohol dehydrogenase family)